MPLHPDAAAYLEMMSSLGVRDYHELGVQAARAQQARIIAAIMPTATEGNSEDRTIAGPGGDLPIRIFRPDARPDESPACPLIVAFHGGGWVTGSLDSNDAFCRYLARELPCVAIAVNYRLAPEHRFPCAVEDAYAAVLWASEHAVQLEADPGQIGVTGISAGGALAAAATLMAKDRGGPQLSSQLLIVPATDFGSNTASYQAMKGGPGMSAESMDWFWSQYLASAADAAHPYASPLRAADLSGLPPAVVITAEFDPLRDQGIAYAEALSAAGVPVVTRDYPGMLHAFRGSSANAEAVELLRELISRVDQP